MEKQDTSNIDIVIKPVGFVKSTVKNREPHNKEYYLRITENISEIEIDSKFSDALDGLDGFSHIMVIYWPHLIPEKERGTKSVHPMGRKDLPLQGVFATRSPARPNPVLISMIELLERNNNILKVKGLDALDGSPVIDIKPVFLNNEGVENPKMPDWAHKIHQEFNR